MNYIFKICLIYAHAKKLHKPFVKSILLSTGLIAIIGAILTLWFAISVEFVEKSIMSNDLYYLSLLAIILGSAIFSTAYVYDIHKMPTEKLKEFFKINEGKEKGVKIIFIVSLIFLILSLIFILLFLNK